MPTVIPTLEDYLARDSTRLANTTFHCPECGRDHTIPIEHIRLGTGLLPAILEIAAARLGQFPQATALIYDRVIETLVQSEVIVPLTRAGFPVCPVPLGEKGCLLDASVDLGDATAAALPPNTDFILGIGSGVISDLTKWIATQAQLPFILYGTAPSMNAHTSITSTMTEHGIKTSKYLDPALAVLFDVSLLRQAPLTMLQAGLGDLAARFICNADYRLSSLVRGTPFCSLPYRITAPIETQFAGMAAGVKAGDPAAIEQLGEAILVSGLSMTMLNGETSPSSGAEHACSHYWDLLVELEGAPKSLHGTQVALGTLLSFSLYHTLRNLDPTTIDPERIIKTRPQLDQILAENARYGSKAYLFDEVVHKKWLSDEALRSYLAHILQNWSWIWAELEPYLGSVSQVRHALESAGMELSLAAIRRTPEQARLALLHGSRYRARYTALDLAWELGVFPDAVDDVLAYAVIV